MLKRLLIIAMLAVVAVPAMAEQEVETTEAEAVVSQAEMEAFQTWAEDRMYEQGFTPEDFDEQSKVARQFLQNVQMKIVVGHEYVPEESKKLTNFGSTLFKGKLPNYQSGIVFPYFKDQDGNRYLGKLIEGRLEFQTIDNVGGKPRLAPETIVYEFFLDYEHCDEHGFPRILDRDGRILPPGAFAMVVNWIVLREVIQTVQCAQWNFWVGLPWCINVPGFKEMMAEATEDFFVDYFLKMEEMSAEKGDTFLAFEGAMDVTQDSYNLAWTRIQLTFDAEKDGVTERQFFAHAFFYDYDSDGLSNDQDPDMYGVDVKVPDLVGKTEKQAKRKLKKRDLTLSQPVAHVPSDRPAGEVLSQSKEPGTKVPKGTAIGITVSSGPQTQYTNVPCPPAPPEYWDLAKAKLELAGAHLEDGEIVYVHSDSVPKDKVIRFDPPCGTSVPVGTVVKIYISLGKFSTEIEIPCYIIGDPYNAYDDELMDLLLDAGFKPENIHRHVIYCPSNPDCGDVNGWQDADCWQTYKWSWECGDTADPDTAQLHYWVKGCLPNLVNCDKQFAIDTFEAAGFGVTVLFEYSNTVVSGKVTRTDPAFGEEPTDCSATIWVSKGPQQTNPLSASFTSPTNGASFQSGDTGLFKMNIVDGTGPFKVRILVETGPVPGWQEIETMSRTPQWSMNLNSTANPGPSNAHAYGWVKDATGAETQIFSVAYTVH